MNKDPFHALLLCFEFSIIDVKNLYKILTTDLNMRLWIQTLCDCCWCHWISFFMFTALSMIIRS